jgi:hypothetical protein
VIKDDGLAYDVIAVEKSSRLNAKETRARVREAIEDNCTLPAVSSPKEVTKKVSILSNFELHATCSGMHYLQFIREMVNGGEI